MQNLRRTAPTEPDEGWRASLALGFRRAGTRTVLIRRDGHGPLQVQRPFYPEGDVCHVYLLHPPGGVVGGDRLDIDIDVSSGARALVTTPAAGKFYRSDGPIAEQRHRLTVAGVLEWLPLETIVFAGARARSATRIDLRDDGRFIGWEVICLGRPAASEAFITGCFDLEWSLHRHGRPVLWERSRIDGGCRWLRSAWGLGGAMAMGTLLCSGCDAADVALARAAIAMDRAAVTWVDDLLVVRCLGDAAEGLRAQLSEVWRRLRPRLLGLEAAPPRIWST